jgi:lipopolysaccharide transport system ATP-binding protein
MKRAEIVRRFDEIVAFAEIEEFLETPVKHYSSGMYMRLAFSVAAHLEPEILIVDEVLAVGDAQFQKKCLGKMEDVSKAGRTVLFVSHNMTAISALCGRCIYLAQGKIQADSQPERVITHYLNDFQGEGQKPLALRMDRSGNGKVRVTNIRWLDGLTRQPLASLLSGQEVYLELEYQSLSSRMIDRLHIGLSFYTQLGQFVMVLNSQMANRAFVAIPSEGHVYCHLHRFPLMSGRFTVTHSLNVNGLLADQVENALTVDVETGDFFGTGIPNAFGRQGVYVPQTWMTTID